MNNNHNTEPESQRTDFPGNLLARVMKADGAITIEQVCPNGDILFCIPLRDAGVRREALIQYSLTYSSFFVDLIGEVLVRKNIHQFAELLALKSPIEYHQTVNQFQHRHFGLCIDERDIAHIRFHSSLIQQILVEDLDSVLMGWLS